MSETSRPETKSFSGENQLESYILNVLMFGLALTGAYTFFASLAIDNQNQNLRPLKSSYFTISVISLFLIHYIKKSRDKMRAAFRNKREKLMKSMEKTGELPPQSELVVLLNNKLNTQRRMYIFINIIFGGGLVIFAVLAIFTTVATQIFNIGAIIFGILAVTRIM